MKLEDQKDSDAIKDAMRQLLESDAWDVIRQSLEVSIEHIERVHNERDLIELPAEQYKFEQELVKAKCEYLRKLMNLPNDIIEDVSTESEGQDENPDPYN